MAQGTVNYLRSSYPRRMTPHNVNVWSHQRTSTRTAKEYDPFIGRNVMRG